MEIDKGDNCFKFELRFLSSSLFFISPRLPWGGVEWGKFRRRYSLSLLASAEVWLIPPGLGHLVSFCCMDSDISGAIMAFSCYVHILRVLLCQGPLLVWVPFPSIWSLLVPFLVPSWGVRGSLRPICLAIGLHHCSSYHSCARLDLGFL